MLYYIHQTPLSSWRVEGSGLGGTRTNVDFMFHWPRHLCSWVGSLVQWRWACGWSQGFHCSRWTSRHFHGRFWRRDRLRRNALCTHLIGRHSRPGQDCLHVLCVLCEGVDVCMFVRGKQITHTFTLSHPHSHPVFFSSPLPHSPLASLPSLIVWK